MGNMLTYLGNALKDGCTDFRIIPSYLINDDERYKDYHTLYVKKD